MLYEVITLGGRGLAHAGRVEEIGGGGHDRATALLVVIIEGAAELGAERGGGAGLEAQLFSYNFV